MPPNGALTEPSAIGPSSVSIVSIVSILTTTGLLGASNPGVTTEWKMTSSLAVSSERGGKPAEELTHDPAHKTRSTCCLPRQPRLEPRASLEPALGVRGVCGRVQARRRARSGALASHKHQGTPSTSMALAAFFALVRARPG